MKLTCLFCHTILTLRHSKKYCNNKCQADYNFQLKWEKWLRNEWQSPSHNSVIRRMIAKRDGYKCNECGISEWNNKKLVLEIEHKDGNSLNNKQENLCLLCPNCHSQTPTFKGRNRGNGRFWRKQRYQQGKSY